MIDALADGVDARVERLQRIAHDDAALAMQSRALRERRVGTDADRHDDQIGRQRFLAARAVDDANGADSAVRHLGGSHQLFGLRLHQTVAEQKFQVARRNLLGHLLDYTLRHILHYHRVQGKHGSCFSSFQQAAPSQRL